MTETSLIGFGIGTAFTLGLYGAVLLYSFLGNYLSASRVRAADE